jgi:hypothetical protein
MSTLSKGTITSNTTQTGYNSVWASIYDGDMQVPQIWGEIVKRHGAGIGILEFLYMTGAIVPLAGPTKKVFEEGSLVKTVALNTASGTTLAGADVSIHLADTEFTSNYNSYLSLHDQIVVPAKYLTIAGVKATKPELFQVTTVTPGVKNLQIYVCSPLNSTAAIATTIPAATKLMVTGGNYANGTASGKPKSSGFYTRLFYTSTKKADWSMTGSIQSNERYYEKLRGGGTGIFTKATMEADFLLSKYINDELFIGGGISNTITGTDRDSNSVTATGTVGLLQHMVDRAMKQYYTSAYQYTDFDDIKDLLISQGVVNRDVAFFMGSLLYRQIENAGLDFLKEFAGGTQLMKTWNELNIAFRVVNKNGVYTTIKELPSLSDPTAYGAAAFDDYFKGLGMIIPEVDVTVRGSQEEPATFKIKNLALGYKNYGNENRTRINKIIPGVANVGAGGGDLAVDSYDDVRGTMLSEFGLIANKVNQYILVQNDNVL